MENDFQLSASFKRRIYRFALIVWTACFTAVLLRILTIHPLDPYSTPYTDIFEEIFLTLLIVSTFESIFLLLLKPLSKSELKQLPSTFLDGFLNTLYILSGLCMIAGAAAIHFLGGVPMMQNGAYFISSGSEMVRTLSAKEFSALSYLISPIAGKGYYNSISLMWWMLMLSSKAAHALRRQHLIQVISDETNSAQNKLS